MAKSKPPVTEVTDAETGAADHNAAETGAIRPSVRKKEFLDRVTKTSGIKKQAVKTIVDAVLAELAASLANGEEPNLPPLGKMKVNRRKSLKNGELMIVRMRRLDPKPKVDDEATEGLVVVAE